MYCIDRGPQLTGGSTTWPTFTVFEQVCCWKKERKKQNESCRVCVCGDRNDADACDLVSTHLAVSMPPLYGYVINFGAVFFKLH